MKDISDNELLVILETNKPVPERDPGAAARGRANFLREASELRAGVSSLAGKRLMAWNIFTRKDGFAMKALFALAITFVFLAAGGMTVYAAQDDLPNQPLYNVKIWSEDVGLAWMDSPSIRMEQLMNLAQRRVDEMAGLASQGVEVPAQVTERFQKHIEEAMQIAAGQSDEDMQASLLRIRERLQMQEQALKHFQGPAGQSSEAELERARQMVRAQIRIAEDGLTDPQQFRHMHQNQERISQTASPTTTSEGTATPQATSTPAGGYGPGPGATPNMGTPMPNGNDGNNPGATPGGDSNGNGSGGGGSGGGTDGGNKP